MNYDDQEYVAGNLDDILAEMDKDETDELSCKPCAAPVVTEKTGPFWACAEVYQASRRPSRWWVAFGNESPDAEDENGDVAYPFNGMGGIVVDGPFDTKGEAEMVLDEAIAIDEDGYTYWA